jgi:hypothetical protein
MSHKSVSVLFSSILIAYAAQASTAETIGGVEFPLGERSFADEVVSFFAGTGGVSEPPSNGLTLDGLNVSLGNGGELVVEFVDNLLVDQDSVEDGLDLFIFEAGDATEAMQVSISKDGIDFIELGVLSGQPTGFDIGPFITPGDEFRFVKVIDVASDTVQSGPFAGADIDAIGAIGSTAIPEPTSFLLLGLDVGVAVAAGRRLSPF